MYCVCAIAQWKHDAFIFIQTGNLDSNRLMVFFIGKMSEQFFVSTGASQGYMYILSSIMFNIYNNMQIGCKCKTVPTLCDDMALVCPVQDDLCSVR